MQQLCSRKQPTYRLVVFLDIVFKGCGLNQMLFISLDDDTLKVQRKPNAPTPKPVVERPWWLDNLGTGKM